MTKSGLSILQFPKTPKPTRKQWDAAQARYNELYARKREEVINAEVRWGNIKWASLAVQKKIDSLQTQMDKVSERIYKMLEAAPRDWTSGVPITYVCSELSYDDAFSPLGSLLSREPPKSYGY